MLFQIFVNHLYKYTYLFRIIYRHFSHVTKSRVFKNLNLRRKADRNFRGNMLKNHFRQLKFYSNLPSWLASNLCHMSAFWKTKGWSSNFWEGQPFRFCDMGVLLLLLVLLCDMGLLQVFLFNLRLWLAQEPKLWSFFYGKSLYEKIMCCKSQGRLV